MGPTAPHRLFIPAIGEAAPRSTARHSSSLLQPPPIPIGPSKSRPIPPNQSGDPSAFSPTSILAFFPRFPSSNLMTLSRAPARLSNLARQLQTPTSTPLRSFSTTPTMAKSEFIVILPDQEGALDRRMKVRGYVRPGHTNILLPSLKPPPSPSPRCGNLTSARADIQTLP